MTPPATPTPHTVTPHTPLTGAPQGLGAVNELLKAIFAPTAGGFIPTVELRQLDNWEWKYNVSDYLGVVDGMPPRLTETHLNPTSVHYFCPGLFSEQNRLKEYFHSSATLWADFDDPQNWNLEKLLGIEPRPSAVVESSPGKFHVYWFLDQPERRLVVEDLNRRLAYNLGADHGCWNANRLLRLPYGVHGKADSPTSQDHPVVLRYINPEQRYTPDHFQHLSSIVVDVTTPPEESEVLNMPAPLSKGLRNALLDRWEQKFTPRLARLLKNRSEDRSGALWQIWADCHMIGIPKDEAFQLVYGTPNDKFEPRRSHDEDLWKDVLGGYTHAITMGTRPVGVIEQLENIRRSQATGPMKIYNMGKALTKEMLNVGEFFISEAPAQPYYMDTNTNRLYHLSQDDRNTQKLFHDRYAINAAGGEFRQLMVACISEAMEYPTVKVHRLSHYDEYTNTIYLNRYDGFVYKVTKDGWEQVRNGEDRVLFVSPRGMGTDPWKITDPGPPAQAGRSLPDPNPWNEFVFGSANLKEQEGTTPDEIRHIIKTWVVSMFFRSLMKVKPILFMHGEAGSGKTAVFKNINLVLYGEHAGVNDLPEDRETYDFIVGNNDHVFFDNVDSWYRWLPDKLAITSTGYTFQKRRLYTDNDQLYYAVNCFVGVTARTPKFMRDDIAQRVIPIKVAPYADKYEGYDKFTDEHTIITNVMRNRNQLWGWMVDYLIKILQRIEGGDRNLRLGFRMVDFAIILKHTCDIDGIDFNRCIRFMKAGQAAEAVDDDPMVEVLQLWMERPDNVGRWISASDLLNEFQYYNHGALREKIRTPIGLATRIGQYKKYFSHAGIHMDKQEKPKMYRFRILTPEEREKFIDDD